MYIYIYIHIQPFRSARRGATRTDAYSTSQLSNEYMYVYIYICCSKLIYTYMYVYTDICLADVYLYIYITVHILRCSDFFSGEEPREASPEGIYVNMCIYIYIYFFSINHDDIYVLEALSCLFIIETFRSFIYHQFYTHI